MRNTGMAEYIQFMLSFFFFFFYKLNSLQRNTQVALRDSKACMVEEVTPTPHMREGGADQIFSPHFFISSLRSFIFLQVHVLPQEMLGRSTFGLSMWLLKWFPVRLVDQFLLLVSGIMLGDTARFGLHRPKLGPLQLKSLSGKTPVLDVGTLANIRAGNIKVGFYSKCLITIFLLLFLSVSVSVSSCWYMI